MDIGCEYVPSRHAEIADLVKAGEIDHVQVSLPTINNLQRLLRSKELGVPIVIHSTLLSLCHAVDPTILDAAASIYRAFNPSHIVEHFSLTEFKTKKSAVSFWQMPGPVRETVAQNYRSWRQRFSCPVGLETVPYTGHDWVSYIHAFHAFCDTVGSPYVYDLPHIVLGGVSAGMSLPEISSILRKDPMQVHIGGIKRKGNVLWDSHDSVSGWLLNEFNFNKGIPITLEQRAVVTIPRSVKSVRQRAGTQAPSLLQCTVVGYEYFNQVLANENLEVLLPGALAAVGSANRDVIVGDGLTPDVFSVFDRYHPFIYPVFEFNRWAKLHTRRDAMPQVGRFLARALNFGISMGVCKHHLGYRPFISEMNETSENEFPTRSAIRVDFKDQSVWVGIAPNKQGEQDDRTRAIA